MDIFFFLRFFLALLSIGGIVLNSLLIFAIAKKSPSHMRTYPMLLLYFSITDIIGSILCLLLLPRIYNYFGDLHYILMTFNGPGSLLGGTMCMWGFHILNCLNGHLAWVLLANFVYRWYILFFTVPTRLQLLLAIFIISIPTFVSLSLSFRQGILALPYQNQVPTMLNEIMPDYSAGIVAFGLPQNPDQLTKFCWFIVSWPYYPNTGLCIVIRFFITYKLHSLRTISEQSKKAHKQFILALTLNILVMPIGALPMFGGVAWRNLQFATTDNTYFLALFLAIAGVALLNPCCQFYSIKPYRRFIKELWLCSKKPQQIPQNPTVIFKINGKDINYK